MPRAMRNIGRNLDKLSGEFHFHKRGCYDHGCDHFSPRKSHLRGCNGSVSFALLRWQKCLVAVADVRQFPTILCLSSGQKVSLFSAKQCRRKWGLQLSLARACPSSPYRSTGREKEWQGRFFFFFFPDRMLQHVLNLMCGSPLVSPCQEREKQYADTRLWYFFAHIVKFISFNEPRLHFCPTLCFCFVFFYLIPQ